MSELISNYVVRVHPDRVLIQFQPIVTGRSKHVIVKSESESDINIITEKRQVVFSNDGQLSNVSKRKIKRGLSYLCHINKHKSKFARVGLCDVHFKLVFATFTLSSPQIHSDTVIRHKLLNQLIVELKSKYGVEHFVYRSEKQSNGNVHFHFVFDRFLPHDQLRSIWNRIQEKLGYVTRYHDRMSKMSFNDYYNEYSNGGVLDRQLLLNRYLKGKRAKWFDPNSVDVHKLDLIRDIDQYLIKYMSKSEQNKGIEGRLWSCSHSLSNLSGGVSDLDSSLSTELNTIISHGVRHRVDNDYCTMLFIDVEVIKALNCNCLYSLLFDFLKQRFSSS